MRIARRGIEDRNKLGRVRWVVERTIDDSVTRRVETRLDIEELRLTGVEPLE